jgi:acyl-coenzyme A thioesterase PaaI-like protein
MVTKKAIETFLQNEFPQVSFIIECVGEKSATIRKEINHDHLRPGGTVSGPVLMELADLAVTTSLNINFLRKPSAQKDLVAKCHLIKVGKLLAIGEVSIYSEGSVEVVAHAVGTYAIPPASKI